MIDKSKRKRQKKRVREIMEGIQRILFEDWDEDGINQLPGAPRDAYDYMIRPVFRMLRECRSPDEIAWHLHPGWRERPDLPKEYRAKLLRVVDRLCAVDVRLDEDEILNPRERRAQDIVDSIRRVFEMAWLPTGVAEESANAFDRFIGDVYRLLAEGLYGEEELAGRLAQLECSRLRGRKTDGRKLRWIVRQLSYLNPTLEMSSQDWWSIREKKRSIRRILNEDWDPIGVHCEILDEYDTYVPGIYKLLTAGSSREMVAEHLLDIQPGRRRTQWHVARAASVAEKLCALDIAAKSSQRGL